MRIVLLCATHRGYLFLKKLIELSTNSEIIVFSFREEPWEPPFLEKINQLTHYSGVRFLEAKKLDNSSLIQFWESTPVDLMLAVCWRYMIPPHVYRRPRLGTFVFHDSLLPKYRGFSPTVWAISNGEDHTGVTVFEIADEIDAGDIIDQKRVDIEPDDTIATVMEYVTKIYLDLLESNLPKLIEGNAPRYPQDHSQATYTCKRLPEDNEIDWSWSSKKIYNLIRAVAEPYPGAYTYLSGKKIKVWSAKRLSGFHPYVGRIPGRVVETRPGEGSVVLTGNGALLLTQVQIEGAQSVCATDVFNSLNQTLGR